MACSGSAARRRFWPGPRAHMCHAWHSCSTGDQHHSVAKSAWPFRAKRSNRGDSRKLYLRCRQLTGLLTTGPQQARPDHTRAAKHSSCTSAHVWCLRNKTAARMYSRSPRCVMPLQRRMQQGVHLSESRANVQLFTTSQRTWAQQGNAVARLSSPFRSLRYKGPISYTRSCWSHACPASGSSATPARARAAARHRIHPWWARAAAPALPRTPLPAARPAAAAAGRKTKMQAVLEGRHQARPARPRASQPQLQRPLSAGSACMHAGHRICIRRGRIEQPVSAYRICMHACMQQLFTGSACMHACVQLHVQQLLLQPDAQRRAAPAPTHESAAF